MIFFQQIDDMFSAQELAELQDFFQTSVAWTYELQPGSGKKLAVVAGHWVHKFLSADKPQHADPEAWLLNNPALRPIGNAWLKLKERHFQGHTLLRCYAQAHTFGLEDSLHVDSRRPGYYCAVVHVNPIWKPEWAGETVFFNDVGDVYKAVLPKPGRVLAFDARITHVARGLSRSCPAARIALMFKTCTETFTKGTGRDTDTE
jgi:hypothetical protein